MANRYYFFVKLLFFSVLLLTSLINVYPDETQDIIEAENIIIDNTEDSHFIFKYNENNETEFIQKIYWEKSSYDLKYDFSLKDSDDNVIIEEEMKVNFIELSLKAGEYLYQVITYNILEQPEYVTDWLPVTINKTFIPKINTVSVENIYIENLYNDPIIITGKYFTDEVTVYIQNLKNPSQKPIYGKIKEKTNEKIVIQFRKHDFNKGEYDIVVSNPGKVYASRQISVKSQKPVDVFSTTAYAPVFNAYSGTFNELLKNVFYPLGVQMDITLFPLKFVYGYIGFGLVFDFNYFEEIRNISLHGFFMKWTPTVNYLYYFNKYVGALLRFGVGLSLTALKFNYGSSMPDSNWTSLDPFISVGAGVQIRPYRGTSVFIGLDYSQIFYKDSSAGLIEPFIAVGYYL